MSRPRSAGAGAQLASLVALDAGRLEACIRERGDELLQADLAEGERLGIRGTPTFLVDG